MAYRKYLLGLIVTDAIFFALFLLLLHGRSSVSTLDKVILAVFYVGLVALVVLVVVSLVQTMQAKRTIT